MAERGYRWSYRVLDSQHFGVPQRRRRVFVVGVADDDPRAERIGEVLALAEGGGGDSPTSEPSWPDVAARIGAGAPRSSGRIIGALTESGGAVTMDHQSFVSAGQYVTRDEDDLARQRVFTAMQPGESSVARCLTTNTRMDAETEDFVVSHSEKRERERERERSVVNAVTSTIQYGADDSTAQAGHLIVEEKS
jgi:site-specific DNA-cytosine methylase